MGESNRSEKIKKKSVFFSGKTKTAPDKIIEQKSRIRLTMRNLGREKLSAWKLPNCGTILETPNNRQESVWSIPIPVSFGKDSESTKFQGSMEEKKEEEIQEYMNVLQEYDITRRIFFTAILFMLALCSFMLAFIISNTFFPRESDEIIVQFLISLIAALIVTSTTLILVEAMPIQMAKYLKIFQEPKYFEIFEKPKFLIWDFRKIQII